MTSKTRWQREQELLALFLDDRAAFRATYREVVGIAEPQPLPQDSDWDMLLEMLDKEFPIRGWQDRYTCQYGGD